MGKKYFSLNAPPRSAYASLSLSLSLRLSAPFLPAACFLLSASLSFCLLLSLFFSITRERRYFSILESLSSRGPWLHERDEKCRPQRKRARMDAANEIVRDTFLANGFGKSRISAVTRGSDQSLGWSRSRFGSPYVIAILPKKKSSRLFPRCVKQH